jgi:hypothetical protein
MHFEINAGATAVAVVAARLEAKPLRTMYDSTNPNDIPTNVQLVAGYVSGPYAWPASAWARFSGIPQVRIATQAAHNVGNCLDVERGDATPEQAPGWVMRRRAAGVDPTVYCNELNSWPAVRAAFRAQGVPEPHYWVSRYSMALEGQVPAGAVARQYADPAVHGGGHYDLSAVLPHWPGIDPEEDMSLSQDDLDKIAATIKYKVLAADDFRFNGRNPIDMLLAIQDTEGAQAAALAAITDDETNILAAIRGLTGGQLDPQAFAAQLAPALIKAGFSGVTNDHLANALDQAAAALRGQSL